MEGGVCCVRKITAEAVYVDMSGELTRISRSSTLRLAWSFNGLGLEANEGITIGDDIMPSRSSIPRVGRLAINELRADGSPVRRAAFADPHETEDWVKQRFNKIPTAEVLLQRLQEHKDPLVRE
jgi:hypothetical protein